MSSTPPLVVRLLFTRREDDAGLPGQVAAIDAETGGARDSSADILALCGRSSSKS